MGSGLISNYSAKYIAQANVLTNRSSRIKIIVEDDVDIRFWNDILSINGNYTFEVISFQNDGGDMVRGKDYILHKISLGKNLMVAVDSDYDYLLSDLNNNAKKINNSNFVLHTYTYSIENYICYPDTLDKLCLNLYAEYSNFNFQDLYKDLSNIVYPLFVWSLFLEYIDKDNTSKKMPRNIFFDVIKSNKKVINNDYQPIIEDIQKKVCEKLQNLEQFYPQYILGVKIFEKTLVSYGVNSNNVYLFINGHALCDFLIENVLLPICKQLRSNHIGNIYKSKASSSEKKNKVDHYNNQYGFNNNAKEYIERELNKNFEYRDYICSPYKNLINKIMSI